MYLLLKIFVQRRCWKLKGTTRWNVNKSITKQNPFLSLAEKHHMDKVTKGCYYSCFWSQHGKERIWVQNLDWILLMGGWGVDIFETGDSKALEKLMTDYFIPEWSKEEKFSTDEDGKSETEPTVFSLQQNENNWRSNDCIRWWSWRNSLTSWDLDINSGSNQSWHRVRRQRRLTVAVENKAIDVSECIRVQWQQARLHLSVLNRRNPRKKNGHERTYWRSSAFLNIHALCL